MRCRYRAGKMSMKPDMDRWELEAASVDAIVTRKPRNGIYTMGAPGSRSRILAAHEATGFYVTGKPRPKHER